MTTIVVRKEPTFSGLAPDKDDNGGQARRGTGSRRVPPPMAPPPVKNNDSGSILSASLVVALLAVVASGYLYWQNTLYQQRLNGAESRLAALEKQLELTGDESTQSVAALQAKLKWAESEIRKLWGVSYDTNRKNIASLTDGLKSHKGLLDKTNSQLKGLGSELQKVQASLANLEKSLGDNAALRRQLQSNADQVNKLKDQLSGLKRELAARVRENEEAVEAIDAYRLSHNREFQKLKDVVYGTSSP